MAVQTQIQTRRGAAATWTSTNPTLAAGEIGFESDTNKFKIGTGSTAWASLPYAASLSPLTTKGDLYTYSTADARLAVGANGETLVADSSTSTGLRYQVPVQQNPVLNSAFQIWQRGTTFTASSAATGYTADRWLGYRSVAGGTISRQVTNDTTNLPFIQYCARVQRDSGNNSTATINFYNGFESINSIPYAGKTVTLSFYARKGADYSSTTTNVLLTTGTGTDQNPVSGFTGSSNVLSSTLTPTTTWARYSYTVTIGTTATQIAIAILQNPLGTAGAADYLEITGVQLEVGSVATPFKTYAATLQGELAACQRYYVRNKTGNAAGRLFMNGGSFTTSTNAFVLLGFPVEMRVPPTSIDFGGILGLWDWATDITITNLALTATGGGNLASLVTVTVASGGTQFRPVQLEAKGDATAYIGFNAEL
jgi:hypothetical protein